MNIPDEVVEAAARASVNYQARKGDSLPWDALAKFWRDYYRTQARSALEAAAPFLMAQAWNEGAKAMMRAVSEEQSVSFIAPYNPYRS